jgi:hypothetical protein
MQQYLINFFVWWYAIKVRNAAKRAVQWFIFILEYTNTLTMARYLTVPLYQDMSRMGRLVGLVIRGTWVWFGGMLSVVLSLPLWIFLVIYAALPVIVIAEIVFGIINLLH